MAKTIVYISTGRKSAMRTLRVCTIGKRVYRDRYVRNLSRDAETAVEKARAYYEDVKASMKGEVIFDPNGSTIELNGWGENMTDNLSEAQLYYLRKLEVGVMPFGKYVNYKITDLPDGYVMYFAKQEGEGIVGKALIDLMVDEANERNLFEKEEERLAQIEAERAKSEFFGEVGQRGKMRFTVRKTLAFDGYYGTVNMMIGKDEKGRTIVYKGTKRFNEGDLVEMVATIKDHNEYKGEKQTIVNRPAKVTIITQEELEAA